MNKSSVRTSCLNLIYFENLKKSVVVKKKYKQECVNWNNVQVILNPSFPLNKNMK